jgi:ankyrin repeat protein
MTKWIDALKRDSLQDIKTLISENEDVNDTNESGESVLAYALRSHCDFSIIELLIEAGADIYHADDEGVSVFEMAITYNNHKMIELYMKNGIDVNSTKRKSGFTPLMCAACYGRYDVAKILLENGADKDVTDTRGLSAVDFARKTNKKSILKLFDYDESSEKNTVIAR